MERSIGEMQESGHGEPSVLCLLRCLDCILHTISPQEGNPGSDMYRSAC